MAKKKRSKTKVDAIKENRTPTRQTRITEWSNGRGWRRS